MEQLGVGLYLYLGLVLLFSTGILMVFFFTQSRRRRDTFIEPFNDAIGPKDGDIVVNVSLMARSFSKELGKIAKEVSKNISSLK